MCENPDNLIEINKKTDIGKYEFLRAYYPVWNFITKISPRVIVDTHAGTGLVKYRKSGKEIYGSPLLALIKTLTISTNLKIILNEKSGKNYQLLEQEINNIKEKGLRVFQTDLVKSKQKLIDSQKTKKVKPKNPFIFPDSPETKCPNKYHEIMIKTNAQILTYNNDINDVIEKIFEEDIPEYSNSSIKQEHKHKTKCIFFIDPCGSLNWSLIENIGRKSEKTEGIEIIINWSYDAIHRNKPLPHINRILSDIYGIPIKKIPEEFENIEKIHEFRDKYKEQLKKFWKYIVIFDVPRSLKIKPKSDYKMYFLFFCTNNSSGFSIAKNALKRIRNRFRKGYMNLEEYFENLIG